MKISVIVPCRNEASYIREFLDSLLAQELDPGQTLEVLIADGMSTDGTRAVLDEYCAVHANVRRIDNPGKIVSTGLNEAIRQSTGDVLVRMDGHTIYARDYVRQCVRVLEETGAANAGGPWRAEGRGWMGRAIAAAFQSRFCAGGGKAHNPSYEGEVDTVYLGCWRREVFDAAGLFDPALVRNQDDEFNFRLRRLGLKIWQSPAIRSAYAPRGSLAALFRQYSQYGFWRVVVMRKHHALASARQAVPGLFVASLAVISLIAAVAAISGAFVIARWSAELLGIETGVYMAACLGAAAAAWRKIGPASAAILPLVIATYHVSYGWGFLMGLLRAPRAARNDAAPAGFFTALTR